jgi:hypothetical protein
MEQRLESYGIYTNLPLILLLDFRLFPKQFLNSYNIYLVYLWKCQDTVKYRNKPLPLHQLSYARETIPDETNHLLIITY